MTEWKYPCKTFQNRVCWADYDRTCPARRMHSMDENPYDWLVVSWDPPTRCSWSPSHEEREQGVILHCPSTEWYVLCSVCRHNFVSWVCGRFDFVVASGCLKSRHVCLHRISSRCFTCPTSIGQWPVDSFDRHLRCCHQYGIVLEGTLNAFYGPHYRRKVSATSQRLGGFVPWRTRSSLFPSLEGLALGARFRDLVHWWRCPRIW